MLMQTINQNVYAIVFNGRKLGRILKGDFIS